MLQTGLAWLKRLDPRRGATTSALAHTIPASLWNPAVSGYPFLLALSEPERARLRTLCTGFLAHKEFHGSQGLEVTDAMALAVAAQACLPLLHMGDPPGVLDWYGDFVGIVLHPADMLARREATDESGVVHRWSEVLAGEALQGGPLALSWSDVAAGGQHAASGYNVVIHEFVHVIDMHGKGVEAPDGCPLLPRGFLGHTSASQARAHWKAVMLGAYQRFCDAVSAAERFAGLVEKPWLDAYGAHSVDEFFAVSAEAYFVAPDMFARELPEMRPLYDAFFKPGIRAG